MTQIKYFIFCFTCGESVAHVCYGGDFISRTSMLRQLVVSKRGSNDFFRHIPAGWGWGEVLAWGPKCPCCL